MAGHQENPNLVTGYRQENSDVFEKEIAGLIEKDLFQKGWINNFITNHLNIKNSENRKIRENITDNLSFADVNLIWFSFIHGGYAWKNYVEKYIADKKNNIADDKQNSMIKMLNENFKLENNKDYTLNEKNDEIFIITTKTAHLVASKLNLIYFVSYHSGNDEMPHSGFYGELKNLIRQNICRGILPKFIMEYYKFRNLDNDYANKYHKGVNEVTNITVIMTYGNENYEEIKKKAVIAEDGIKKLINYTTIRDDTLLINELGIYFFKKFFINNINFIKDDDNIFGRFIRFDVEMTLPRGKTNTLTIRIFNRPYKTDYTVPDVENEEMADAGTVSKNKNKEEMIHFRNDIIDKDEKTIYLNDDGLLLFQELITENRMKIKGLDIDGERRKMLIRTKGLNMEEYISKFLTLYNNHISKHYKYSKKFLNEKKLELYKLDDKIIINDNIEIFENNLISQLRGSINAVILSIQRNFDRIINRDKNNIKIFISGGDAYRRYLGSIEKSADIDAKIYFTSDAIYEACLKIVIPMVIKYVSMLNNVKKYNNDITINFDNSLLTIKSNCDNSNSCYRIRTKKTGDYSLISIDYEVTINLLDYGDQKYNIENYKHQVAVLDLVFEKASGPDFTNIQINKFNEYFLPVASVEFLKKDLNILLTDDIKKRIVKNKHVKDLIRYNELIQVQTDQTTSNKLPSPDIYKELNNVNVKIFKYLNTEINDIVNINYSNVSDKEHFKQRFYLYCCMTLYGIFNFDKMKSPFSEENLLKNFVTNCKICNKRFIKNFEKSEAELRKTKDQIENYLEGNKKEFIKRLEEQKQIIDSENPSNYSPPYVKMVENAYK